MADTTGIAGAVENATTVDASAAALINGFQSLLAAAVDKAVAANDNADLSALTDLQNKLKASSDDLAAAVAANTPSA